MEEKGIKAIRGRRRETLTPRDATDGIDKNRNSQKRKKKVKKDKKDLREGQYQQPLLRQKREKMRELRPTDGIDKKKFSLRFAACCCSGSCFLL